MQSAFTSPATPPSSSCSSTLLYPGLQTREDRTAGEITSQDIGRGDFGRPILRSLGETGIQSTAGTTVDGSTGLPDITDITDITDTIVNTEALSGVPIVLHSATEPRLSGTRVRCATAVAKPRLYGSGSMKCWTNFLDDARFRFERAPDARTLYQSIEKLCLKEPALTPYVRKALPLLGDPA